MSSMQCSISISFLAEKLVWVATSSFPRAFFEQVSQAPCASQGWAWGNVAVRMSLPQALLWSSSALEKLPLCPKRTNSFFAVQEGICVLAQDMLPECLMCVSLAVVCGCQTERAGDTVNAVVQLYLSFLFVWSQARITQVM